MKNRVSLTSNATLIDLQKYVDQVVRERGFDRETLQDVFILLAEEVGELARIVRKRSGIKTDTAMKELDVAGELADILIYILHISNIVNVDLAQAFIDKEEINNKRTWK